MPPTLIVITGPTGSGKTQLAISLAQHLGCEIISADSRQMYRGIPIVTAAPTAKEQALVRHHLVGCLDLTDYYSAANFEADALAIAQQIWRTSPYAIVCGGSMMYIDALCNGIDLLPNVSPGIRARALAVYTEGGLEALTAELRKVDPHYLSTAPDLKNHKRLVHALELSWEAGRPYSSMLTGQKVTRPFSIIKFSTSLPREELFERINLRVDRMITDGLEDEARSVYPLRQLNSLNTVGLKEMFAYFDGIMDRDTAIARIAKNTRVYAKKQMTWLKRDPSVTYVSSPADILPYL